MCIKCTILSGIHTYLPIQPCHIVPIKPQLKVEASQANLHEYNRIPIRPATYAQLLSIVYKHSRVRHINLRNQGAALFSSSVSETTQTVLLHLHIRPHAFRNFRPIWTSLHLRFNSIYERITQIIDRAIINESIMGFFIAVPKPTLLLPSMNKYLIIPCQFTIFTDRDNQAQAKCLKHKTHFLQSLIFIKKGVFNLNI